jgi:VIT1/CCC1 family predicted Fe2+/Mn2+ transporter
MLHRKQYSVFIRNFTFGVEDSLVSTVGLLAGIAVAGVEQQSIILTGLVLIFVEAFSMGVGSLLSERSVEEYESRAISIRKPLRAAMIMFVSYVCAGFIPLGPYFYGVSNATIFASIALTLVSLFLLGAISAQLFRSKVWRDGLFTLLMGSLAIGVGVAVGQIAGRF